MLTDDEITRIHKQCIGAVSGEIYWRDFARAIEAEALGRMGGRAADAQRCIDARNRLWAVLDSPGAVIGSLEEAVGEACARLASRAALIPEAPEGLTDDWLDVAYERLCASCKGAGEVPPTLPTFVRGLIGMIAPTVGEAPEGREGAPTDEYAHLVRDLRDFLLHVIDRSKGEHEWDAVRLNAEALLRRAALASAPVEKPVAPQAAGAATAERCPMRDGVPTGFKPHIDLCKRLSKSDTLDEPSRRELACLAQLLQSQLGNFETLRARLHAEMAKNRPSPANSKPAGEPVAPDSHCLEPRTCAGGQVRCVRVMFGGQRCGDADAIGAMP